MLARGSWDRVLHHVKSGGGGGWVRLVRLRRLQSVADTVKADVATRPEAVGHWAVSSVARQYGVSPALLFRWRALDKTGGLVAVETGENTVPASKYAEALDEIKRLQRLLGQATADNALLKDAVEIMQSKKWIAR